jgi:catechol 2,3-dioxygenase-like lactoylglutathione lyase family enzyme
MLSTCDASTAIPTRDMATARRFYEDTLGFTPTQELDEGVTYTAGNSSFFLYESTFAGTNKATAMTFAVPDDTFDDEAAGLRNKGVEFQTWELPAEVGQWQDGVAVMGGMKSAWFTDPDGNILNIVCGMR